MYLYYCCSITPFSLYFGGSLYELIVMVIHPFQDNRGEVELELAMRELWPPNLDGLPAASSLFCNRGGVAVSALATNDLNCSTEQLHIILWLTLAFFTIICSFELSYFQNYCVCEKCLCSLDSKALTHGYSNVH